jgi:hypothetical protein
MTGPIDKQTNPLDIDENDIDEPDESDIVPAGDGSDVSSGTGDDDSIDGDETDLPDTVGDSVFGGSNGFPGDPTDADMPNQR